jgi:hypothetical protein
VRGFDVRGVWTNEQKKIRSLKEKSMKKLAMLTECSNLVGSAA